VHRLNRLIPQPELDLEVLDFERSWRAPVHEITAIGLRVFQVAQQITEE
jgi:hypothetical protein